LIRGDKKEFLVGPGAISYADLKSIIERIVKSEKLMKEMIVMPFNFGMSGMAFGGPLAGG
jgi:hypothetical protein